MRAVLHKSANFEATEKLGVTCPPHFLHAFDENFAWIYLIGLLILIVIPSSTQPRLHVPYLSTDFVRRAFSYSSPATWNSIPTSIKIVLPYTVSSATSSFIP